MEPAISRPTPLRLWYGARIGMLVTAMTANMLLDAALALKGSVLYSAYDQTGRLWGFEALADETLVGLIMWIPCSAVCVPACLVLLHRWGAREMQVDTRPKRGIAPKTAAQTGNHSIAY